MINAFKPGFSQLYCEGRASERHRHGRHRSFGVVERRTDRYVKPQLCFPRYVRRASNPLQSLFGVQSVLVQQRKLVPDKRGFGRKIEPQSGIARRRESPSERRADFVDKRPAFFKLASLVWRTLRIQLLHSLAEILGMPSIDGRSRGPLTEFLGRVRTGRIEQAIGDSAPGEIADHHRLRRKVGQSIENRLSHKLVNR